jgi:hypothetical protein
MDSEDDTITNKFVIKTMGWLNQGNQIQVNSFIISDYLPICLNNCTRC